MKYLVRVDEVRSREVEVEANSPDEAARAAVPNPIPGLTELRATPLRQLDGPWVTVVFRESYGVLGGVVTPRFGQTFNSEQVEVLKSRGKKISWTPVSTGPQYIYFQASTEPTAEQLAALTEPLKSKSVMEVLAMAKGSPAL